MEVEGITVGGETFINLLATAYFLEVYLKLEVQGLKVLIGFKGSRPERKVLIKV